MSRPNPPVSPLSAHADRLSAVGEALAAAEETCGRIAGFEEADAERARAALAQARGAFSEVRLAILRRLDVDAVHRPEAREARQAIRTSYVYPSAAAAQAIGELLAALTGEQTDGSPGPPPEPAALGIRLREAIDLRGDNKKSAAAAIKIAPKTLDRLLADRSTKPTKREAAERYIADANPVHRR